MKINWQPASVAGLARFTKGSRLGDTIPTRAPSPDNDEKTMKPMSMSSNSFDKEAATLCCTFYEGPNSGNSDLRMPTLPMRPDEKR
jgi:hypothetical protein